MHRLTIDLTEQQQQSLRTLAQLQGKTLQQYAVDTLLAAANDEDAATPQPAAAPPAPQDTAQPDGNALFGMWQDRPDMADVAAYVRRMRAPRHTDARGEGDHTP